MKTTLSLDDHLARRLKAEAARRRTTMSALVETAIRDLLEPSPREAELPPLPSFDGGGTLVDVADREALYRAMEGR